MRLIKDTSDELSIVTLDSYSPIENITPWIYRNPEFNEHTGALTMSKSEKLFDVPERVYGNTKELSAIIRKDWDPKGETLGTLLVGKKGMGKSLLAEDISMEIIKLKHPVIHVTRPVTAAAIEKAVELMAPCVLYLEEFEKCFTDPADIPVFLNLFSSSTIKGLLVIIAANSINNVMYDPLLDRPQRLRFRINYSSIPETTVDEILTDQEVSPEQKKIYTEWVKSSSPNIDSLITLVKLTKHLCDPNDLVEYISILNVPKLNPLRYRLKRFTVNEWNFPVVARHPYKFSCKSMVEPTVFNLAIDGQLKFSTTIDLTVEDPDRGGFTVTDVLTSGEGDAEAKIHYTAEFELTREDGLIQHIIQYPIASEFSGTEFTLVSNGKHVEGMGNDVARWEGW